MSVPRREWLRYGLFLGLSGVVASCRSKGGGSTNELGPLLAPGSLASRMDDIKTGKTAVFYVGPDVLFSRGHVPGARKLKALDSDEGLRELTDVLAKVPPATEIVLYCGCCPVRDCPNVRPASTALRGLGRTNTFVLDLPTRFATDWVEKGYPVERG